MNNHEMVIDSLQENGHALPVNYTVPEVHDLGNAADLTLGGSIFASEDGGRWC